MSKAHDPHWRYIALALSGDKASRRALGNAVLGKARKEGVPDEEAPQLTRFQWPHAIVKVHHHRLAETREWLPRVDFVVEGGARQAITVSTMKSSGTIRTLTERLGILQERGKDPKKGGPAPANRSPVKSGQR